MKLFKCGNCGNVLYFENRQCENCSSRLGYLPEELQLAALRPGNSPDSWEIPGRANQSFRFCRNVEFDTCNWLLPAGGTADSDSGFCLACRHNRIIPDLSVSENLANWRLYEFAKHRLFYTLIGLGLHFSTRAEDPNAGLAFDFLAETPDKPCIMTGHEDGLITLNLKEADDAQRAQVRLRLGEPYRTVLGHLRHESGHYIWDHLITGENLERFRGLFGDERRDYAEALRQYYVNGPSGTWASNFVSAYASAHPWEDFAETWAHYLHIVDTMEMAHSFGLSIQSWIESTPTLNVTAHTVPSGPQGFGQFIDEWRSVTVLMNSLNRCMGGHDLYPFVLSPPVVSRLAFIHSLVVPVKARMGAEVLSLTA